ncbi:MAG: GlsB/YeaQ/YmgE family stress response membrane protein [Pirellulaceae bacterium]|nr:GlsB/YeaQ/YmgE family stress response membrane protein [Pirellulaceae bacterium]
MFSLGSVISWMIFGLIVGGIARFLIPGQQPLGWIKTIGLGILGSFLGGTLGSFLASSSETLVQPSGWIMSIVGAILILFIAARVNN